MSEMSNKNDSDDKLTFTFEFVVKDVSKIEEDVMLNSPEFSVADLTWKLLFTKEALDEKGTIPGKIVFATYLSVTGKPKLWCCFARWSITLLSQSEDVKNISKDYEHLFSAVEIDWGSSLIDWNVLVDPQNGYMKNDAIKFQVRIVADKPQNMDQEDEKNKFEVPENHEDWLAVFEDRINDKIVSRISAEFKEINSLTGKVVKAVDGKEDLIAKKDKEMTDLAEKVVNAINGLKDLMLKKDDDIVSRIISAEFKEMTDQIVKVVDAVDGLKDLMLKKNDDEEADADTCDGDENNRKKKNVEKEEMKPVQKSEAVTEEFVMKMLNDFKNDLKKEFFSQPPQYPSLGHLNSWLGYAPFSTHPHYKRKFGFDHCSNDGFGFPECEFLRGNQSGYSFSNKRKCNSSSCSITPRQLRAIEKFLEKNDGSESDSCDSSPSNPGKTCRRSKQCNPSMEEALQKNLNVDKP